ncbi:carbonic anhydrase [Kineococcus sp. TBRC 1896]|uniref:Carbonic anhydrase n=1 Tax=Kineococcus mangrovi TaxID=1660183 RepID=A0ABV4I8R5_9ACTN
MTSPLAPSDTNCAAPATTAADTVPSNDDPRTAAWIKLQDGNRRWARGSTDAVHARSPQRRADLVAGQTPFAMILSCADSRVPAELVFDQGLGDLFVVRTAGHAVDDTVLGSLEYAVAVLGVDLVLVLGHEGCGAVAATAAAVRGADAPGGYVRGIVERLSLHVGAAHHAGVHENLDLSRWHAGATADLLQQRSSVLREAVFHGQVAVRAATYELGSGLVVPVGTRPAAADTRAAGLVGTREEAPASPLVPTP